MAELLFEMEGRFESGYPDIKVDPEIITNIQAIDDDPLFVTLPIIPVGATSRNKRHYSRAAVEVIVASINNQRNVANEGHMREEDRPYDWKPSPARWLAAEIVGDMAWGKFYVLQSFPQIRDHMRVAKATKAAVGTSIYGEAYVDEDGNVDPETLQIESVDFAAPNRLGFLQNAKVPLLTQETVTDPADEGESAALTADADTEDPSSTQQETHTMPDEPQLITELRADNDRLTTRVRELEALEESNRRLNRDMAQIRTQLNIAETADPIREIHRLQSEVADQQARLTDLTDIAIAEAVNAQVEVETARAFVSEQLQLHLRAEGHALPSKDTIRQVLETVLKRDSVKAHITAQAQAALGPNITKPNRNGVTETQTRSVDELFPVAEGSN